MHRKLILGTLFALLSFTARAACTDTLTDCPNVRANTGTFGGHVFGTVAPTGTLPDSRPAWGYTPLGWALKSTSDNAATTTTGGQVIPSLAYIQQAYGGSNINDGRNGLSIFTQLTAPTAPSNPYPYYVGFSSYSTAQVPDNGTSATPKGVLEAVTGAVALNAGATNFNALIAAEFAMSSDTGSSSRIKTTLMLDNWPSDAVHGSFVDSWIFTTALGTGFDTWATISAYADPTKFPILPTGTVIRVGGYDSNTLTKHIANGFDFTNMQIDDSVLKWGEAAWTLKGNGDAHLNTVYTQGIHLDMTTGGGFFISGTLPSGTPATFACFASGGQLISSPTACQ